MFYLTAKLLFLSIKSFSALHVMYQIHACKFSFYVKCTPSPLSWSQPLWLSLSPSMQMCLSLWKIKKGTAVRKMSGGGAGGRGAWHIKIE